MIAAGSGAEGEWEQAYLRFETREQEIRKFRRRLLSAGAARWPRDLEIAELFCGRAGGLAALRELGFQRVIGLDLTLSLLRHARSPAALACADCRRLPLADASRNLVVVHGGLHHLVTLPEDLELVLAEIHRVLRPDGRLLFVEPWWTPFLGAVHTLSEIRLARWLWAKLDAFYVLTEHERITYDAWLGASALVLRTLDGYFERERCRARLGKLHFLGRRRERAAGAQRSIT